MILYLWPMILVVISNVLYNISSKSVPVGNNPFVVLVVTYITAAVFSLICFYLFDDSKNLHDSLKDLNWTGFALGLSMVGLEVGYIFLYRMGWKISVASLVANILLAIALLIIGIIFYNEHINARQYIGILLSMAGVIILLTSH